MIGYRTIAASMFFLMGAVTALPAAAQTVVAEPQSVASALRAKGMEVEAKTDGEGDPMLMATLGGKKFAVYFYGCKNHKSCETVQFYTGFNKSEANVDSLNSWNRTNRFGRAYIDKEGDPCVVMDINLTTGMPRALFEDNIAYWTSVVRNFQDYVLDDDA